MSARLESPKPLIAAGLIGPNLDELAEWLSEHGLATSDLRMLPGGMIRVDAVDRWIGVPPPSPDMVWVNLFAPDPIPDEEPGWLEFYPGEWVPSPSEPTCCWTSDLSGVSHIPVLTDYPQARFVSGEQS